MSETSAFIVSLAGFLLWAYASEAHRKIAELKERIEKLEKQPVDQAKHERLTAPTKSMGVYEEVPAWNSKVAANKAAEERTARNREVKRRAKERKASAQRERLLLMVSESQQREQVWRNEVARKQGWPIHPNDMELGPEERKAMLEAWSAGNPPKPEWIESKEAIE